ncbi:alkaline phosphatase [Reyranella sp. CPCC 100927]|uniref:alkaline phosphatase D family protein n=1 Tax=Reyranella sp. CPCC 100927 TaxID=2599616 RepID=UPI0011B74919|nr:alkaline phosphatase [Reyranella sp. CPCC 100927]
MNSPNGRSLRRRRLLRTGTAAGLSLCTSAVVPRVFAQTSDRMRPQIPFGVQTGDIGADGALVWAAADRPARMIVEYATTESFRDSQRLVGPSALDVSDYTARIAITGIAPGQTVFYRVTFLDLGDYRTQSAPSTGSFRVPPASGDRDVSFVWTGDTAGQGFGINPDWGGMRLYDAMRRTDPDFLVHCGDQIYADNPIASHVTLDDGSVWRNVVTEEKAKVAETLREYRGNYRYNLMDDNVRRLNAAVPTIMLWDDHEVRDNWFHAQRIQGDDRYREKSVGLLAARGMRAFQEYSPIRLDPDDPERLYRKFACGPHLDLFRIDMRSYRGDNGPNRETARSAATDYLGPAQLVWLKRALLASTATWKVIAADMPLGLVSWDDAGGAETPANGDHGAPLGRELEIAGLLSFIRREAIHNVVWITADVHYCATHYYDPGKATVGDFLPFYEFISGPANAGGFGALERDGTFGPQVLFQRVPPANRQNLAPSQGMAFFGHVKVDGRSGLMTVSHRDADGAILHTTELAPTPGKV